MNKRLRKKIPHVWMEFTLGKRKHAPYRRDQLWNALGRPQPRLPRKPWVFARRGPKYRPTPHQRVVSLYLLPPSQPRCPPDAPTPTHPALPPLPTPDPHDQDS